MAFMMPVVKNEWDIYKTNRSRRSSECSNPQTCRSRKVSVSLKKPNRTIAEASSRASTQFVSFRSVPFARALRGKRKFLVFAREKSDRVFSCLGSTNVSVALSSFPRKESVLTVISRVKRFIARYVP
ncbi:hypothetical protein WH47_12311 [Habropoda laboriosa]|uniref:Uncharacterized protein n=1 Tax=Habropoda laboriosa TaxID=597456 RepID=A0A0L7RB63_9HYME|nr:hypothetical protein WH47_12311 [Habropoda laboriosa]